MAQTTHVPRYRQVGKGRPVVLLHGGPGDTCDYLEPLAALLADYSCILYDQRGSGGQPPFETVGIADLLVELEALREELQQEQLLLIGHSWGATLALAYACSYPDRVARMVLIGLGPLNNTWQDIAAANLLRPLNQFEKAALATAKQLRDEAIEAAEWEIVQAIIIEITTQFMLKAWFYDQTIAQEWADSWTQNYGVNPIAWRSIQRSLDQGWLWQQLALLEVPTLALYGYQDFEPVTQAYALREHMAHCEVALINRAGHLPWMEQPDATRDHVERFLNDH